MNLGPDPWHSGQAGRQLPLTSHSTTPCHRYTDTVTELKTTIDNAPDATSNTHTKNDFLKAGGDGGNRG